MNSDGNYDMPSRGKAQGESARAVARLVRDRGWRIRRAARKRAGKHGPGRAGGRCCEFLLPFLRLGGFA